MLYFKRVHHYKRRLPFLIRDSKLLLRILHVGHTMYLTTTTLLLKGGMV